MENFIEKKTLKQFKIVGSNNEWTGADGLKRLFDLWKRVQATNTNEEE